MTRRNLSQSTDQDVDDLRPIPATSTDGWNDPTVKDPLSTASRARRARSTKDTRRWCRGKIGREHTLAILKDEKMAYMDKGCRWVPYYVIFRKGGEKVQKWHFSCTHHELCTTCGRRFRYGWDLLTDCPDYVEEPSDG